jgi:two-component system sensor histidine kinase GlrK
MSIKPTTILNLILLGFIFVAIPLTIGLLSTVFQVGRMADEMQKTVHESAHAVESGRLITAQALSMERSAGQYLVLRDEKILERYESQRRLLAQEVERLSLMPLDQSLSVRLQQMTEREEILYQKLKSQPALEQENEDNLLDAEWLSGLVHPIPLEVTHMVTRESNSMHQQINQVQQLLLWQAGALIPIALLIAITFSVLISRPLQRLGSAIRQLGAGQFNTVIDVTGPQDIHELGRQLDWLRQQLAALDEHKILFLQHISHELKTPLAAIREGAGLLRDGIVGKISREQLEVVQILHENSLQLQEQVESLLNFNLALEQDKLISEEIIDLATLIPAAVKKYRLAILSSNISIIPQLHSVWVRGAPEQLQTVIDNLLSNAIKYSDDDGEIEVRLYQKHNKAVLDMLDDGIGVLANDKPHLFEPFYQGRPPANASIQGTGLGLSLVKHYLLLHGGSVELVEIENSTCFRVTLPLAQKPVSSREKEECTS